MDLIIHHAKCPDGFCAAFVAGMRYPEAELLGLDHGEPVPFEKVRGKDVLVVDFSWPDREDNIQLHNIAKSFHIYDHHKTAREKLEGLDFATFDMQRSGAGLTWDYLFGKDSSLVECTFQNPAGILLPRPWWVCYVEDRDLWLHLLPDSKAVSAYIMSLPMTVEAWQSLSRITVEDAVYLGTPIVSHIDRYVKEAVDEAAYGIISDLNGVGYSIGVINIPYMNCSEVGNVLAKETDMGMTWFERSDGLIQFSLRSEGDIDVSVIAKAFKGGGHKHAAGFRLPIREGRDLIDFILGREV